MRLIKRLVVLALVLAAGDAGWHVSTAWFRYQEFQDAVREAALFGVGKPDEALKDQVMDLAQRYDVPLDRDYVEIQRIADRVKISASYAELVTIVPGYKRRFDFDVTTR